MLLFKRYILRHTLLSCAAVTGVLVGAVWVTQTLRFVETVFKKIDSHALWVLIELSVLMLPSLVTVLLPIGLALGCLFSLHRLLEDREIVAFWAGGVTTRQLLQNSFWVGMAAAMIVFFLQAYVSPLFMAKFRNLERSVRQNVSLSFIESNVFQEFGDITLYVRAKYQGELYNVLAYVQPPNRSPYTLLAEKGAVLYGEKTPKIVLEKGVRQEQNPDNEGRVSSLNFDRTVVELGSSKMEKNTENKKPGEYYLWELLNVDDNHTDHFGARLSQELHQRLIVPLLALLFPLLVSFILLSGKFQRRGYGKRIAVAVISVLSLQAVVLIASNTTVFYVPYFVYGVLLFLGLVIVKGTRLKFGKNKRLNP